MKKIIISAILTTACLPAFAVMDANIQGSMPGAVGRQNIEQLQKLEAEKTLIQKPFEEEKKPAVEDDKYKEVQMEDGVYNPKFLLNKIEIEGNTIYPSVKLEEFAKDLLGKEIFLEDILDLTIDISRFYQQNGYLTCYAYLPPQEIVEGIVKIKIEESPIESVEISGNKWARDRYLRYNVLGKGLKEGETFNAKNLQSALRTLNKEDYLKGTVSISKNPETDATKLNLDIKDRFPLSFDVLWDDYGRDYTGRQRATMMLGMDNLTGFGDKLYGGTILSSGMTGALAGYQIPVGPYGTRLSFDYAHSDVKLGGPYKPLNIRGAANDYMFRITHPLYRSATTDVIASLGYNFVDSNTTMNLLRWNMSDFQLNVIRPAVSVLRDDKYGRWIGSVGSDVGFASSKVGGGLQDRTFYRFTAGATRVHRLPFKSIGIARLNGQYSPQALFSSEQMQIGGPYSIRGYQPGQLLGDYGVAGSLELRTPIPGLGKILPDKLKFIDDKTRLALFYDWGYIKEHKHIYDFQQNFLQSVGFGCHIELTKFLSGQIGVGFPLGKKYYKEDSARVYFSINSELDKIFLKTPERL